MKLRIFALVSVSVSLGLMISLAAGNRVSGSSVLGTAAPPRPHAVVAGMQGTASFGENASATTPVRFHDALPLGELLRTGSGSVVEILLDKQALVTVHEHSGVRVLETGSGALTVHISDGAVSVAVARAGTGLTLQTPTATGRTWGGLLHVVVLPDTLSRDPAGHGPPHLEIWHVIEGTLRLQNHQARSEPITVEANQSAQVLPGVLMPQTATLPVSERGRPLPAVAAHAAPSPATVQQLTQRERAAAESLLNALQRELGVGKPVPEDAAGGAIIPTTASVFPAIGTSSPAQGIIPSVGSPTTTASGNGSVVSLTPAPSPIIPTTGLTPSQLPQVSPSNHGPAGAVFSVPDLGIGIGTPGHSNNPHGKQ
jgi:hypothetical protein